MARIRAIHNARATGVKILAWTSLAAAVVGGALNSRIWVGELIADLFEALPWGWVPLVILVVIIAVILQDLLKDGEPNHKAIYGFLLLPSIAISANDSKLADTVSDWTTAALDLVMDPLKEWLGTSSTIALALAVTAIALVFAQRSVKRTSGGVD